MTRQTQMFRAVTKLFFYTFLNNLFNNVGPTLNHVVTISVCEVSRWRRLRHHVVHI
jgi:hypothetical protein